MAMHHGDLTTFSSFHHHPVRCRSYCCGTTERGVASVHIQIVNFHLNGIDETQYRQACELEAPTFAAIPGLLSKVWLVDQSTNTYGGVYTWRDRQAMEDF